MCQNNLNLHIYHEINVKIMKSNEDLFSLCFLSLESGLTSRTAAGVLTLLTLKIQH